MTCNSWVKWQHPQGLPQQARPQAEYTHFHIPVTVVNHAQMHVYPGADADQALNHSDPEEMPTGTNCMRCARVE